MACPYSSKANLQQLPKVKIDRKQDVKSQADFGGDAKIPPRAVCKRFGSDGTANTHTGRKSLKGSRP
eukprot:2686527-Amphidinium_carterae.1